MSFWRRRWRIHYDKDLKRLWLGPGRWHHYHTGAVLIALGIRYVWVDRDDFLNWVLYAKR